MKILPAQETSFKPLHKMLIGAISARLLTGGLNLRLFDAVREWRTAEQAAADLGADIRNTEYFLDALTNIGLLEKKAGRYRNMPLSARYLVSGSDYYVGDLFAMIRQMSIDPLTHLEALVRKGPGTGQTADGSDSRERCLKGARASMPWAVGEMGSRVARIVEKLEGFTKFKKMLDIGGGHGLFSLYIVQASETLKSVIFDQAPVTELALETIAFYELDERVSAMPGDYLTDNFGSGYHLVFASATLNNAMGSLNTLISKIYNALEPNGYFISLHDGMTHEKTQPALILEWLGGLLESGEDFRFEQGELADAMLRCGFRTVRSHTMETPIGAMELDIARK